MAVIGKIRQQVGLLVFIIALAILAFLLMDATGAGRGAQSINVGELNGVELSAQEYNRRVEQTLNNVRNSGQPVTEESRLNAKNSAWRSYIKDVAASQQYDELGVEVGEEEMEELLFGANAHQQIQNTPIFKGENGLFDPSLVMGYIDNLKETNNVSAAKQWKTFTEFVDRDRKSQKYGGLIGKAMYIPTWLAEMKNDENNVSANIEYVKIPYTQVEDSEVSFSDNDLRSYLNANKEAFDRDASRSVDYISFAIEASDKDIENIQKYVNDYMGDLGKKSASDMSNFIARNSDTPFSDTYETASSLVGFAKADEILASEAGAVIPTHLDNNSYKAIKVVDKKMVPDTVECRHILRSVAQGADDAAAKKTIDSLLVAVQNGYDFEAAASAFSDDGSNKEQGGDLGKVTKGMMVPEFNNGIFFENVKGDLFTVKTQFGWHLVEITDAYSMQQGAKIAVLSRAITASSETIRSIYSEASEFIGRNKTEAEFRNAAEEAGYTVKSANDFVKEVPTIEGLGASERLMNWAFASDKGEVSEVFDLGEEYIVAILTDTKEEGMPALEDVRIELENKVKQEKKAAKIAEAIGANADLNAIAGQYNVGVESQSGVRFGSFAVGDFNDAKAIAAATALGANETSKPIAGETGVYIVKVIDRSLAPELSDFTALQKSEQTKLTNGVQYYTEEALINSADLTDGRLNQFR